METDRRQQTGQSPVTVILFQSSVWILPGQCCNFLQRSALAFMDALLARATPLLHISFILNRFGK